MNRYINTSSLLYAPGFPIATRGTRWQQGCSLARNIVPSCRCTSFPGVLTIRGGGTSPLSVIVWVSLLLLRVSWLNVGSVKSSSWLRVRWRGDIGGEVSCFSLVIWSCLSKVPFHTGVSDLERWYPVATVVGVVSIELYLLFLAVNWRLDFLSNKMAGNFN